MTSILTFPVPQIPVGLASEPPLAGLPKRVDTIAISRSQWIHLTTKLSSQPVFSNHSGRLCKATASSGNHRRCQLPGWAAKEVLALKHGVQAQISVGQLRDQPGHISCRGIPSSAQAVIGGILMRTAAPTMAVSSRLPAPDQRWSNQQGHLALHSGRWNARCPSWQRRVAAGGHL